MEGEGRIEERGVKPQLDPAPRPVVPQQRQRSKARSAGGEPWDSNPEAPPTRSISPGSGQGKGRRTETDPRKRVFFMPQDPLWRRARPRPRPLDPSPFWHHTCRGDGQVLAAPCVRKVRTSGSRQESRARGPLTRPLQQMRAAVPIRSLRSATAVETNRWSARARRWLSQGAGLAWQEQPR